MIVVCLEAQHGSAERRDAAGMAVPAPVPTDRGHGGDCRERRDLGGGLLRAGGRARLHRGGRVRGIELLHHGDALEHRARCSVVAYVEDGVALARVQSIWTWPLKIRVIRLWVSSTVPTTVPCP